MRWEVKAAIQATLSRAPMGHHLHRKLQDVVGSSRLDIEVQYERKRKFLGAVQAQGLPLAGRSFLEVGAGWHPVLPLILHLLGAERVATIDVNPWLTRDSLQESLRAVRSIAERIAGDFGLPPGGCRGRLDALIDRAASPQAEPGEVLKAADIAYSMPVNACKTPFGEGEFDYVVSSNVLEHVPPVVIRGMAVETKRILKPGGWSLHHVDPGDHFSIGDSRITTANFVRYSPRAWHYLGGSGLAYHNRLRCVDYVRLFEDAGLEVIHAKGQVDAAALRALESGRLRPHADFKGYTLEELAERDFDLFARVRAA